MMLKSVKMFFKNKYNYRKRRKTQPYIPLDTWEFKLVGECVRHQFFGGGATLNEPRIPLPLGIGSVNNRKEWVHVDYTTCTLE